MPKSGIKSGLVLPLCAALIFSCTGKNETPPEEQPLNEKEAFHQSEAEPVTLENIVGSWYLFYPNDLGYEFVFRKNYRAFIILYLGNHSLLFKGVYVIEDKNRVRVSVYEMKRSASVRGINRTSGFTQARSSHFLLSCAVQGKDKNKRLIVRPIQIMIDGNNSDGYLEPVFRLKRR